MKKNVYKLAKGTLFDNELLKCQQNPSRRKDLPLYEFLVNANNKIYEFFHTFAFDFEIEFINSIDRDTCPYCGSSLIKHNGKEKCGIKKYYCNVCKRNFNPLTGTLFQDHKISILSVMQFIIDLCQYNSISSSALINENAINTGFFILKKIFHAIKHYQDNIVLFGDVYVDETVQPKWKSQLTLTDKGKKLRGLSDNQLCIYTALTRKEAYLQTFGFNRGSIAGIEKCILPHIEKGSKLIDDAALIHQVLVDKLNLKREVHPSSKTEGLPDSDNPLYPINHMHFYLKMFLEEHNSYKREDLQDWLNLFAFIWNRKSNYAVIVADLLKLMINDFEFIKFVRKKKKP